MKSPISKTPWHTELFESLSPISTIGEKKRIAILSIQSSGLCSFQKDTTKFFNNSYPPLRSLRPPCLFIFKRATALTKDWWLRIRLHFLELFGYFLVREGLEAIHRASLTLILTVVLILTIILTLIQPPWITSSIYQVVVSSNKNRHAFRTCVHRLYEENQWRIRKRL